MDNWGLLDALRNNSRWHLQNQIRAHQRKDRIREPGSEHWARMSTNRHDPATLFLGCRGRDDHRWLIPGREGYGLFYVN